MPFILLFYSFAELGTKSSSLMQEDWIQNAKVARIGLAANEIELMLIKNSCCILSRHLICSKYFLFAAA